jgi:hypothetical protein
MQSNDISDWNKIKKLIKKDFYLEPLVHNILFIIGIQELNYGFEQLDSDTKTKVINFASMYILKFLNEEDRKKVRDKVNNGTIKEEESEDEIYKQAIINYFESKEII